MGKAIPTDVRKMMVRLHDGGKLASEIANETGYSVHGVRKIIRLHIQSGEKAFSNQYTNCGQHHSEKFDEAIVGEVMRRRNELPGGAFVHTVLRMNSPEGQAVPHARTIQRWWANAGGHGPKRAAKRPKTQKWATEPHEIWQIDGKEHVELATGEMVSWMNIADEGSSAALKTVVFPPEEDVRTG